MPSKKQLKKQKKAAKQWKELQKGLRSFKFNPEGIIHLPEPINGDDTPTIIFKNRFSIDYNVPIQTEEEFTAAYNKLKTDTETSSYVAMMLMWALDRIKFLENYTSELEKRIEQIMPDIR